MLANWPLLLIRVAEGVAFAIMAVAAVIAAIVPFFVSLGLSNAHPESPEQVAEMILSILEGRWLLLLYALAVATIVLLLCLLIHSFIEAASTRVYVDAERAAAGVAMPSRAQLRAFTAERWVDGGKRKWWPVFLIYNIAWGVAGLVMLAPLTVLIFLMLLVRESPGPLIAIGCLGGLVSALFIIAVAVVTNIWCRKAIVLCVARVHQASDALSAAWREFRTDAARHIGVVAIIFAIAIVGAGVLSSFSMAFNWSRSPGFNIAVLPLQMIGSVLNTAFSAAIASWFMACMAALSVEWRR